MEAWGLLGQEQSPRPSLQSRWSSCPDPGSSDQVPPRVQEKVIHDFIRSLLPVFRCPWAFLVQALATLAEPEGLRNGLNNQSFSLSVAFQIACIPVTISER